MNSIGLDGIGIAPVLLDFSILVPTTMPCHANDPDDSDDDDSDDDEFDEKVHHRAVDIFGRPGKIEADLKQMGLKFKSVTVPMYELLASELGTNAWGNATGTTSGYRGIAEFILQEGMNALHHFQGQTHRRLNAIIDMRDPVNNRLIAFDCPSNCNNVPPEHLAESYFDLSRRCLIPRPGMSIRSICATN